MAGRPGQSAQRRAFGRAGFILAAGLCVASAATGHFLVTLAVVVAGMAGRDFLGTMLVVAESRGRDRLAGMMDALGDVAQMVCTVAGVDAIQKGINARSMTVLLTMCLTSFEVTQRTTVWSKRLRDDPSPTDTIQTGTVSEREHPTEAG